MRSDGVSNIRWVVFDYGQVISRRTAALPSIAAMLGAPEEAFETAYFSEREAYDRGCGDLVYWQAIGDRLGIDVDAAKAAKLTDADTNGWLDFVPETLRLIQDIHAAGNSLALLSNASSSFGRAVERQWWADHFEHLIFSGDLRLAKPDAQMWRILLTTIAADPSECLFFDDQQNNIDAARDVGIHAERWDGPEKAREVARGHGLLTA